MSDKRTEFRISAELVGKPAPHYYGVFDYMACTYHPAKVAADKIRRMIADYCDEQSGDVSIMLALSTKKRGDKNVN